VPLGDEDERRVGEEQLTLQRLAPAFLGQPSLQQLAAALPGQPSLQQLGVVLPEQLTLQRLPAQGRATAFPGQLSSQQLAAVFLGPFHRFGDDISRALCRFRCVPTADSPFFGHLVGAAKTFSYR